MEMRDFLMRIFLALILGAFIGLERQLTGHAAGIRINVLICMGSCFFALFPMLLGSGEVFRVESSIIQGIGFLCSGVIFKEGAMVRGLNTAATLWCTSAIGIFASTGMFRISIGAAAALIISNLILRPLARKIEPVMKSEENERQYRISVLCHESIELEIRSMLIKCNGCKTLYLNELESGDVIGDKVEIVAEYLTSGKAKGNILEAIVGKILQEKLVIRAGWEIL